MSGEWALDPQLQDAPIGEYGRGNDLARQARGIRLSWGCQSNVVGSRTLLLFALVLNAAAADDRHVFGNVWNRLQ